MDSAVSFSTSSASDAPRGPTSPLAIPNEPADGSALAASTGDLSQRFVALYRAHFEYVWRSMRKLGIREADLPDLTHDVFVVVHRKLADYDPQRPAKPWLFGIAFRVALDKKRKMSSWRETLVEETPQHATTPSVAHEHLEARESHALVMRALDALDIDKRAAFVLHDMDGHKMPEVAEILDVPLNTLYSRLRAARELFATEVRRLSASSKGGA